VNCVTAIQIQLSGRGKKFTQICKFTHNLDRVQMEFSPIFIVGAERSGTTLFRLMLNHHAEISVCSEFEYIVDPLVGCDGWPDLATFHSQLRSNWIFQEHGFFISPSLSYPELAHSFLEQVRQRKNVRQVVAVVHRNFDQLQRIWPNARYIHIIRDPRDVAKSVIGMGWAANVWHGVRFWIEAEEMWNHMKPNIASDRFTEIKYEDLVCSPEAVLQQVCQFINVDYSSSMLDYPTTTTYAKPNPKLINQWQKKLRPREIELVEARAGHLLMQRGYELSVQPVRYPSRLEQLQLKVEDKLGCLRYRFRQLGFWLFIGEYISRKFHIKSWQNQLEPQLATIWRSSLK
jgi:hypothetical protein